MCVHVPLYLCYTATSLYTKHASSYLQYYLYNNSALTPHLLRLEFLLRYAVRVAISWYYSTTAAARPLQANDEKSRRSGEMGLRQNLPVRRLHSSGSHRSILIDLYELLGFCFWGMKFFRNNRK